MTDMVSPGAPWHERLAILRDTTHALAGADFAPAEVLLAADWVATGSMDHVNREMARPAYPVSPQHGERESSDAARWSPTAMDSTDPPGSPPLRVSDQSEST